MCEASSPSRFLLTKTLILRNYTDGLKYTERQGITPIMQSWLKLGPLTSVLRERARRRCVQHRSPQRISEHLHDEDQTAQADFWISCEKEAFHSPRRSWTVTIALDGVVHKEPPRVESSPPPNEDGSVLFVYWQTHWVHSTAHLLCCVTAYSCSVLQAALRIGPRHLETTVSGVERGRDRGREEEKKNGR